MWEAEVSGCRRSTALACGLGAGIAAYVVVAALTLIGTPLAVGLAHHGADGRGGVGWMLLGGLIGVVAGGLLGWAAALAIAAAGGGQSFAAVIVGHVVAEVGYVTGLIAALELSHSSAVDASAPIVPPSPYGMLGPRVTF